MTKHHFKLSYFPARARGEHLRWMLYISGVDFENHCDIGLEDWPAMKPKTPFGALPVLTVDGKDEIAEGPVIGAFLAAELGFAGKSHVEAARVFMLANHVNELQEKIIAAEYNQLVMPFFGRMDLEAATKLWNDKIKPDMWDPYMDRFEKFLDSNGGMWLVGDRMSWADIFLAEVIDRFTAIQDKDAMGDRKLLKSLHERVSKHPNVVAYNAKRKQVFPTDF